MTSIDIDHQYFVYSIPLNFVLAKRVRVKDKKTGKTKAGEKVVSYHSSLLGALRNYMAVSEHEVFGMAGDIHEFVDEMDRRMKKMEKAMSDLLKK